EDEEKFTLAQGELSALLPKIATGLAQEAEQASEPSQVEEKVALVEEALVLCNNTKYIPKSSRGPEIEEVRATLARINRRQQSLENLRTTLARMEEANAAGDTRT